MANALLTIDVLSDISKLSANASIAKSIQTKVNLFQDQLRISQN